MHAPLYPSPLLYECRGFKMLSVVCETDGKKLKQLLAQSPFEYVINRYTLYVLDMQNCKGLRPFNDSGILIPAKFGDLVGGYMAYEFLTTDDAMAAGREPWGYPKKIAAVKLVSRAGKVTGTVIRNGKKLVDVTCELSNKKLDIPSTPSNPTLLYQVIPKPDGPGALIRRVLSRPVDPFDKGQGTQEFGRARVIFGVSKDDPIHEIKPTKVLGAVWSTGNYKSKWARVLATLEANL